MFDALTLRILTHYIRLRYKLRPYLYQLFQQQAENGEAILRPLFYEFADTPALPLGRIEDQFMVGPAILQAPVVWENATAREVVLPDATWWSVLEKRWLKGARKVKATPKPLQTPLYVRDGQIVPMAPGEPRDNRYDGSRVEAHVFLRRGGAGQARFTYSWDDGDTLDFAAGKRSQVTLTATARGGTLHLETHVDSEACGRTRVRFVLYDRFTRVLVNGREVQPRRGTWLFCGTPQPVWNVG